MVKFMLWILVQAFEKNKMTALHTCLFIDYLFNNTILILFIFISFIMFSIVFL